MGREVYNASTRLCLCVDEFKEVFSSVGKFSVVRHMDKDALNVYNI
jgi:hypothetical protein